CFRNNQERKQRLNKHLNILSTAILNVEHGTMPHSRAEIEALLHIVGMHCRLCMQVLTFNIRLVELYLAMMPVEWMFDPRRGLMRRRRRRRRGICDEVAMLASARARGNGHVLEANI